MRRRNLVLPKYLHLRAAIVVIGVLFSSGFSVGQTDLEEAVKQLTSSNVRGYLQPFVDGFGANLNSGLVRSARIDEGGLSIKFEILGMGTLIGDAEKSYAAVPPAPFEQTPVRTATIFGGLGTVVNGPGGVQYQFQNGQISADIMGLVTPQLTVGTLFGTQATVRYVPLPATNDLPSVTLLGYGLRHSISRYIPNSPIDLSVGMFRQDLTVGGIFEADALSYGLQASKSVAMLTVYTGIQYESSTMNVDYLYTGYGATPATRITMDMEGENRIRGTAGLGLSLAVLNLNADISFGKVTALSASLGFGF